MEYFYESYQKKIEEYIIIYYLVENKDDEK